MPPKRDLETGEEEEEDTTERGGKAAHADKHARVEAPVAEEGSAGAGAGAGSGAGAGESDGFRSTARILLEKYAPYLLETAEAPAPPKYFRFKCVLIDPIDPQDGAQGVYGHFDIPLHADQDDFLEACSRLRDVALLDDERPAAVHGCTCPKPPGHKESIHHLLTICDKRIESDKEALRKLHTLLLAQAREGGAFQSLTLASHDGDAFVVLTHDDPASASVRAMNDLVRHLATWKCTRCWSYPAALVELMAKYVLRQRRTSKALFASGVVAATASPCLFHVVPTDCEE